MKRNFYIGCVMVLVALLATLIHVCFELAMLKFFNVDPPNPALVNFTSTIMILLVGIIGGYFLGRLWWKIIYIEKRYKNYKGWGRK